MCNSLGVSGEWLQAVLVPKLLRWCQQTTLDVDVKSLNLVPIDVYTLKYQELKLKYGNELVQVSTSTCTLMFLSCLWLCTCVVVSVASVH